MCPVFLMLKGGKPDHNSYIKVVEKTLSVLTT